jgi:hypothetical protein
MKKITNRVITNLVMLSLLTPLNATNLPAYKVAFAHELSVGNPKWAIFENLYETHKNAFSFSDKYLVPKIINLPRTLLYPFPGSERYKMRDYGKIKIKFFNPKSLAIHYFMPTWQ